MPDDINPVQPAPEAPSPEPTPQPAGDSGDTIQINRSEWEAAQQWRQQVSGMQPYVEAAKKAGFKNAKDFEPYARLTGTLSKRGLGVDSLLGMLDDPADSPAPISGGGVSDFDEDSLVEKITRRVESEFGRKVAEKEYEEMSKAERATIEKIADEIAGDDASAYDKKVLRNALLYEAAQARQDYEEGHPLHGQRYKPLDDAGFKALRANLETERAAAKAEALASIGDAANKGKPRVSPPAGNAGGQGTASNTNQPPKTVHDMSRDEKIALLQRERKKLGIGGGTTG